MQPEILCISQYMALCCDSKYAVVDKNGS